jgi:hypothetical protein
MRLARTLGQCTGMVAAGQAEVYRQKHVIALERGKQHDETLRVHTTVRTATSRLVALIFAIARLAVSNVDSP